MKVKFYIYYTHKESEHKRAMARESSRESEGEREREAESETDLLEITSTHGNFSECALWVMKGEHGDVENQKKKIINWTSNWKKKIRWG